YARTRTEIAFEVRPIGPDAGTRWIEVMLNGHLLGRQDVGDGWTPVTVPLGKPLYHSAPNVVTIRWRYEHPAGADGRLIGRTGVVAPADLRVVSGGKLDGDRASIQVNGLEYARNRRGYNVAVLDPGSGAVRTVEQFDTFASADASHRLAALIRSLPPGVIVLAAVKDDASGQLTADAVDALRSIGAS